MKKIITGFAVMMLMAACTCGAWAVGWTDDFESYTAGQAVTDPWIYSSYSTDGGVTYQSATVTDSVGYNGSKGIAGPEYLPPDHPYSGAWRAADAGSTVLTTKVMLQNIAAFPFINVGLMNNYGDRWGYGDPRGVYAACVYAYKNGDAAAFMMRTYKWEGGWENYETRDASTVSADLDTWYDLRMTLDGSNVTGEYRKSGTTDWSGLGTLAVYDGFQANYVSIGNHHWGYIDDVGFNSTSSDPVPEPAGLVTMLAGVLGVGGYLVRKK
ncbi:MAG: hypothetical protein ACYC4F_05700 [Armatimonadota bacterium]